MAEGNPGRLRRLAFPLLAGALVAGSLILALIDSLGNEGTPRKEPAPAEAHTHPPEPPEPPLFVETPEERAGGEPETVEDSPAGEPAETEKPAIAEKPPEPVGEAEPPTPPVRGRELSRRRAADELEAGHPDQAIRILQGGMPDAGDREAVLAIRRLATSGNLRTWAGIRKALGWLVAHQDPRTGGIHQRTYGKVCGDPACRSQWPAAFDPGVSGLALIALTAFGPMDVAREFEEPATRLTEYLTRLVDARGAIASGTHYNEAIVALALLESRVREEQPPHLRLAARTAAGRLVTYLAGPAQIADGGWRYRPDEFASDSSVTCWVLQALIEARRAGAKNLEGDIQDGLAFLDFCTDSRGWTGYQDNRSRNVRLTAAAMYVRLLADVPALSPRVAGANRMLLATVEKVIPQMDAGGKTAPAAWEKLNLGGYGSYYLLSATGRLEGENWLAWRSLHVRAILDAQEKEGHLAGTWAPEDTWSTRAGRLYQTAIHALALLAGGP